MVAQDAGIFAHFDMSSDTDAELLATVLLLYLRGKKHMARDKNGIAPLTDGQVETVERILRQMEMSDLMKGFIMSFTKSIEAAPSQGVSFSDVSQELACYAIEEALDPANVEAYTAAKHAWNDGIPLHQNSDGFEAHQPDPSRHESAQSDVGSGEVHPSARLPILPATGSVEKGSSHRSQVPLAAGVRKAGSSPPMAESSSAAAHRSGFSSHQPTKAIARVPAPRLPDFSSLRALFPHMPWNIAHTERFEPQNGSSSATGYGTASQPRLRASGLDGADDEVESWRSQQIEYDAKMARDLQDQMAEPNFSLGSSDEDDSRPIKRVRYLLNQ